MYPQRELNRLAFHKAALRQRLAGHRAQCVVAAARVAQPIHFVDKALAYWRQLSPLARLAAVPLGLFAARKVLPRLKWLGLAFRWGPAVFSAVRGLSSARRPAARG